ncbi:MAG: hypothetical protein AAB709_02585 [Patescibacteria group bacterium]
MLTKEDKNWIEETIEDKIEEKLVSIEESNIRTEEKLDKVLNILDGFAGKVADLDQENRMGAITLRRHDVQIHELATATGTTISE